MNLIGTVGSDEKAALAKEHGAAHVINYNTENFVQRVKEITGGAGVPVVYDSIGKDTFIGSLDCLAPRGTMVSFGNSSGPVPPFALTELVSRGSLYITRPTLVSYTSTRADLEATAQDLFDIVASGDVKIAIGQRFPLAQAADAHRALEARTTTGSTILLPMRESNDNNDGPIEPETTGNPRFGRLLIVLVLAVLLVVVITVASEAYYS